MDMADAIRLSQAMRNGVLRSGLLQGGILHGGLLQAGFLQSGLSTLGWRASSLFPRGKRPNKNNRAAGGDPPRSLMNPRAQAQLELSRYLDLFPTETDSLDALSGQLERDQDDVMNPRNMRGHITTSAVVVDVPAMKALLVHHRSRNRWLHPGGHYEGGLLWASAQRAAIDKTGVADPELHDWSISEGCPIDIDSQRIPARPGRGERAHVHHDFAYLMVADSTFPVAARNQDLVDARWVSLAVVEELGDARLGRIVGKLGSVGILPSRRQ
jgi:hypothetical protein